MRMHARVIAAAAFLFGAVCVAQGATPDGTKVLDIALPYQSPHTSVGIVNCASSLCHGSVKPFDKSNVLQNEYVTWSRLDKHARAFTVLGNAQSERIAKNLGIGNPTEAKVCLDCHAQNVPTANRGDRFRLEDGVGCEACHGPAGKWLPLHVETNASHQRNLDAGLFDTGNPLARAKLCLSCHFGNEDRMITHRIMGAGHPRLAFELDTFTAVQPAHFSSKRRSASGKDVWDGAKVWAIGQALAVAELSKGLANPKRARDGIFPELVFFDCHACHHPMSDKRWQPRVAGIGPGVVRLNDSSMLMTRAIAKAIDPKFGNDLAQVMSDLQLAIVKGDDPVPIARQLQGACEILAVAISEGRFGEAEVRGALNNLVQDGLDGQYRDYAAAEQVTMAIGSIANFLYERRVLTNADQINAALARLRSTVSDDERYKPADFQNALQNMGSQLAAR